MPSPTQTTTSPSERRREPRVPVTIRPTQAELLTPGGWQSVYATIRNLSAAGFLVSSEQELRTGDRLNFAFTLPDGAMELRVRADVRYVDIPEHGAWEAGCEFVESRFMTGEEIARFISAQQRAADSPGLV